MNTALRIVMGLALVFAPWAFGTTETWSIRTLEFLCFLCAFLWVIRWLVSRDPENKRFRRPTFLFLGGLPILLVLAQLLNPTQIITVSRNTVYELVGGNLSLPHTIHWETTWETGWRWVWLLLFAWVVLQSTRTRDDVVFWLRLLVLNAVLVSIEGILQQLSGSNLLLGFRGPSRGGEGFGPGIFGPFVCRNNFASYANLSLPLALGMALLPDLLPRRETSNTPQRFFWGFCASLLFAAVILSSSRMGVMISLLVVCAMLLDFMFRRRGSPNSSGKGRLIPILLLGCGLVFLIGGTLRIFSRFERTDLSEPVRMEAWKALWMAITDSPRWGYGLGTFQWLFPFYKPIDNPWYYEYAHSDWLEAISDLGGIGFFLLAVFVMGVMAAIARERIFRTSTFRRSIASCCLISLAGCLVHALADFPFHIAAVQITFVTIAAIGLAVRFIGGGGRGLRMEDRRWKIAGGGEKIEDGG